MKYLWILLSAAIFVGPLNAQEAAENKQPQATSPASGPEARKAEAVRRLQWFRDAKYGFFIHWGIWSIPAGEWNGIQTSTDPCFVSMEAGISSQEYHALARKFNPTRFDADAWVRLAEDAGMKYIIFVAKHSDGFAMYRSKVSSFNVYDATAWKHDPRVAPVLEPVGERPGSLYNAS